MRCGKVRRNLMAYHDGELGMAAGKKVTKHLETCVECSSFQAAMEKADHAAGSATGPGPDSSYWDSFTGRVMKKVKEEALTQLPEIQPVRARSWFSPVRFAPALSVALVVAVAAGVLMKIRQPAVPESAVYQQDTVVGEEITKAPEEGPVDDLKNKGVTDLPEREQITPEPAPARQVQKPAARKTPPATVADSFSVKKETAADEGERPAVTQKETGIGFAEKDDSRGIVPAPSPDVGLVRSFTTSPSGETTVFYDAHEPLMEEGESLPPGGAAGDGSWGQLAFARRLEEEGRHAESEKVLDDLLARNPSVPVQEQASILMVSVLANQNRLPEARQVLEDAQRLYPANKMIQNLKIRNGEEGIGNRE